MKLKETDVSELSIRKQIAKICAAAGVLPGTYERRDATEIVRKIQESVVSHSRTGNKNARARQVTHTSSFRAGYGTVIS